MAKSEAKKTYSIITQYFINHIRSFIFALGDLFQAPLANLMTILVIGIALALPCGLFILLQSFNALSQDLGASPTITLYLKKNITASQQTNIQKQLHTNQNIKKIKYISPEQGLREFAEVNHFGALTSTLNTNPLPGVFVIIPNDNQRSPKAMQQLANALTQLPGVANSELDLLWVKRLFYLINLGRRGVWALAIIFGIGVIVIVGNTIRLSMQDHLHEINVLKLIGATNAFIRRPLLYRGMLYGLFGGIISWLIISISLLWLKDPANSLSATYQLHLSLSSLSLISGLKILILAVTLGFIGAWLALVRHANYQQDS